MPFMWTSVLSPKYEVFVWRPPDQLAVFQGASKEPISESYRFVAEVAGVQELQELQNMRDSGRRGVME